MSFLSDMFQRKPGGTTAGNFLRGLLSTITNGNLGTGAGMITQKQADARDLTDSEFIAKYGENKRGVPIAGVTPNPNIKSAQQAYDSMGNPQASVLNPMALVMNNWQPIAMILAAIYLLPRLLKKLGL